ncbi:serine acetyltransferase [Dyadobacter sp. CY356]|uniref:serine acetyltransferase n=1 Tax=Dyadobacter sp. CY356 TaxID=2906442 RepID=UPI001F19D30E|nr:DapH/DapD/GlmU-related protein [Dyadobacter sp. CY356]MCF0058321.1 serine acetyltransferase [Dyadobacter sp. CY356]
MERSFNIFQDWERNKGNNKARFILCLFRIANLASLNKLYFFLLLPYNMFYRLWVEWIFCCELPFKTVAGRGLVIFHGQALVVNCETIIGSNCTLRPSTTIGNKELSEGIYSASPIIGNNVDIGSNVCIIGPITIGDNVKIGAGSVVVKNVPSNCIIAGNPARVIKTL